MTRRKLPHLRRIGLSCSIIEAYRVIETGGVFVRNRVNESVTKTSDFVWSRSFFSMASVELPAGKSLRDNDATLSPRLVGLLHPELPDAFQIGDVAIAAGKTGMRTCCKPVPRKIDKPFGRLQTFNKRRGDNVVVGLAEQV